MNYKQDILAFIQREFSHEIGGSKFTTDAPLLSNEGGVLDSLGVQVLLSFIEDQLDVELHDEDIIPQTFHSVSVLTALVERRAIEARESS